MSLALFLVDELPPAGEMTLAGDEGRHAADVARLRVGEALLLGDGAGGVASAVVTGVGRGELRLSVDDRWTDPPPDPRLTVVQGLAKGDRGELAVQAMTEVGVDTIVPWQAARSVVRWHGERGGRALARWRAVAREAVKQSRRSRLPEVADPAGSVRAVLDRLSGAAAMLLLHEEADRPLADHPLPSSGEVVLVVGPEGGIAPEELAALSDAGAVPVRLGRDVLRTSTAGVAALSVLSARLGRWS